MGWAEISIVFFISHLVGDFLLQTDWQAQNKHGGLGRDPVRRRALFSHVLIYTLAFVPALVWVADKQDLGAAATVGLAAVIFLPHLVIDDARLLSAYMKAVKGADDPPPIVAMTVDQSFHLICLWGTALLAGLG